MFKKLSLVVIFALSLSADDGDIRSIENDTRKCNHGISLLKYQNDENELNYYVSWSTSKDDCGNNPSLEWTNNLYYTNAYIS